MASQQQHQQQLMSSNTQLIRTVRVLVAGTGVTYKISLPFSDLT